MSLKYKFRHLFYGGKIHKDRLYKLLEDLDTRITSATGSDTDLAEDISALQTTVGNSSSGLVKDVADIETTIGDEETANSILGRIKALEDAQTPAEEEPSS